MTRLRSQLRSVRQAYRSAHYPGDLTAELLPTPARATGDPRSRRWLLFGGVAASAAAAAVMLGMLLSRAAEIPRPWPEDPSQRALVDWLPIAPESMPLPRFQPQPTLPTLPTVPNLRLDVPGVDRYRDLALPYETLKGLAPDIRLDVDLPSLPELPGRGVEWFCKVWNSPESA